MSLRYSVIEIFTSEAARCQKSLLYEAVTDYVRSLKIAARCMVFKGIEACYENGETATDRVLSLSFNMPLKIEIILPSSEAEQVLPVLEDMVSEGVIGVRELLVCAHKTRKHLIPPQVRVKDMMTPSPRYVTDTDGVDTAVRLLLSHIFTGLPVVDAEKRPVGIISQGDLIYRAGMPLRIGLLARSEPQKIDEVLNALSRLKARKIMTSPDIHIQEDALVSDAVSLMLEKKVKRLPVVDAWGRLTGILSRRDIFQAVARESPDWNAIRQRNVEIGNLQMVSDIMFRDTRIIRMDASVEDVIRLIDTDDIQRVAVVDSGGRFMGLISDEDLLAAFSDEHPGIWDYLTRLIPFSEKSRRQTVFSEKLRTRTAAAVMRTDVFTVHEDTPIDDAIALMTENGIKRLPVLDFGGKYQGMLTRESLLRAGFGSGKTSSSDTEKS